MCKAIKRKKFTTSILPLTSSMTKQLSAYCSVGKWVIAQSVNWSWAEDIFLLVKRKSDLTVG